MQAPAAVRSVARRFIQAWNAGQKHIVDDLASPDLTVSYTHFPEPIEGSVDFKAMLAQTHQFFPDLSIEVNDLVVEGPRAVVHWTYRGTFQEGELFGVPASGQAVEVTGMTLYQIEEGAIRSAHGLVDNFALMMQLRGESK
jgi:steroid delta-isomerase-like uncharacterized protein